MYTLLYQDGFTKRHYRPLGGDRVEVHEKEDRIGGKDWGKNEMSLEDAKKDWNSKVSGPNRRWKRIQ